MIGIPRRVRRSPRRRRSFRRSRATALGHGEPVLEPRVLLSDVGVLQYRYDNRNTGQDLGETALTPSTVNPTDFGKLYSYPVDGYVYAQPLYMANLAIPGQGTHNVVFVATEHDSVYAFDADGNVGVNGTPLWHDSFINPAAGITTLSQSDVFGVGDIVPEVGITATPVIDPSTGALYVVTKTKDIENGAEHIVQELHALNVTTGAEMFGGPVVIADTTVNPDGSYTYNSGPSVPGSGDGNINGVIYFNALTQNERAALVLNHGVIYLSYSSHGDVGPYHGWILGYNAQTLKPTAVFNTTPNAGLGAIWGSGEGLAVDAQGNMYFVTGNGGFDTTLNAAGFPAFGDYGDSVVKVGLDPSSTPSHPNINGWGLKVLDYFTPSDQQSLDANDEDFGSGGPLLLPATATGPQVLLACGKEGSIFVLDTATGKMGEFNPNANNVYQELPFAIGGVWGAPGYFNHTVYYGPVGGALTAFQVEGNNMLNPTPTSTSPETFGYPGPTPDISAHGSSGGIVWGLDNSAYGSQGPAVLYAYDATNLGNELYNSTDAGGRDQAAGAVKFTVPMIANGKVYVGGEYALTIYGSLANVVVPAAPSHLVATALSNDQVVLTWQNNSANETSFTIERSTDGVNFSPVATLGPYVNTYTDGDLSAATAYYYQVIASNSVGSSQPSNTAKVRTLPPTLPKPWHDADIGGPSFPGSASYKNGVFTIFASGDDIWNNADQFHYVYQAMTGDGTILARVDSVQDTDPWAKAGVMMRQSLDADSPFVDMFVTPGNGADFQWRATQGGGPNWNGNQLGVGAPYWVKLVRAGATFTGYASPDGQNWTEVGSITVPMSTQIEVGLCLTAHNDGLVNESTFDYVHVTQATPSGYLAIEAGGGPTGTYRADQDVSGGSTAQFSAPIDLSGVTDPAPMGVYQTERYGTFTYTIPDLKPGALYTVRLHFAEDYWDAAGQRIFNVAINGQQVLSRFDIFAATGAMDTAIVEQFAATPNAQGQIVIAFTPSPNSPDQDAKVDGIEIIPVTFDGRILTEPVSGTAVAGHEFSGTLATFVDTDPGGLARDYIATIHWGDGTTTTGAIQPDPSGSGFDVIGSHTYAFGQVYSPRIVIQSYDGAGAAVTTSLAVSTPLHSIGRPTTYFVPAGSPTGPLVLGTFTDSISTPPPFTTSIVWGDGQSGSGSVVKFAGGYLVIASHTYAKAGTYVPGVTVASGGAALFMDNTTIIVSAPTSGAASAPPSGSGGTGTAGIAATTPASTTSPSGSGGRAGIAVTAPASPAGGPAGSPVIPASSGAGDPRTTMLGPDPLPHRSSRRAAERRWRSHRVDKARAERAAPHRARPLVAIPVGRRERRRSEPAGLDALARDLLD